LTSRTGLLTGAVGIAALVVLYGCLALPAATSDRLLKEDGVIESIGALALFLTAAAFGALAWRTRAQRRPALAVLVVAGLAVVFFVGAGEEISWGQRILDIATPASLSEINEQQETNLHNIGPVKTLAEATFLLLWVGLAVVGPVLTRVDALEPLIRRYVPVLPLALGSVFVLNFVVAKVLRSAMDAADSESKYPVLHRVTETKESVYSVLFAVGALWLLSRSSDRSTR
jgi:hypothetical protein